MDAQQEKNVAAWIEALESGRYEQGRHVLNSHWDGKKGSFCCLGVACELSKLGEWTAGGRYKVPEADAMEVYPPSDVVEHFGLQSPSGIFRFSTLPRELQDEINAGTPSASTFSDTNADLASLNDRCVPFRLIAKVLRARPKGLFIGD